MHVTLYLPVTPKQNKSITHNFSKGKKKKTRNIRGGLHNINK